MRQAAEVKVPAFPKFETLDFWKVQIQSAFQSASGYSNDRPSKWIIRAFSDKFTFEELGDVPHGFYNLDAKLRNSLIASMPK